MLVKNSNYSTEYLAIVIISNIKRIKEGYKRKEEEDKEIFLL